MQRVFSRTAGEVPNAHRLDRFLQARREPVDGCVFLLAELNEPLGNIERIHGRSLFLFYVIKFPGVTSLILVPQRPAVDPASRNRHEDKMGDTAARLRHGAEADPEGGLSCTEHVASGNEAMRERSDPHYAAGVGANWMPYQVPRSYRVASGRAAPCAGLVYRDNCAGRNAGSRHRSGSARLIPRNVG